MTQLKLYILGTPRLECQGRMITLSLRKGMALLIYLAVSRGAYSRDDLASLLWPESDQSRARASLRRTLYHVNKSIGGEIIATRSGSICLAPGLKIWTDVECFQNITNEYSKPVDGAKESDPKTIQRLEDAAAIYKADFLAGFSLPDSPEFDEWQFFETERLRGILASLLRQLISSYEAGGNYVEAIAHARRLLSLDELDEAAHRQLMRLYAKSDQQAAALRQYQECARLLDQELGVAPHADTTELYNDIRLQRESPSPAAEQHRPEVKYVSSGDVHIAYLVIGEGPIDIFWVCGYITHIEQGWELPNLASFILKMSSFSRVIIFDRRGVGLSDRVGYPPTLENTLDDMLAVMEATNCRHPVLFGYLEGGPNSLLFTATYPERVSGLILYGTSAKWTRSEDYPWALTHEQYDRWLAAITSDWGKALTIEIYAPNYAHDPLLREWWAKFLRLSSSPGGLKKVLGVMREIDVRHILSAIRTPTLILHRRGDKIVRVGAARYLAGQIPSAKYVEFEGDDHFFFVGDSQSILLEVETFLQNLGHPVTPERMLATILLLELVDGSVTGSSKPVTSLRTSTLISLIHKEVSRFRGSEVNWVQTRYSATFDGPSRAINCAKVIMTSAHQSGIDLRIGLHTGECEFADGLLAGSAAQIAECVLKSAGANEIRVSGTVKDLVVGSGFQFVERELCVIEGVSGSWKIYSVE